MIDRRELLGSVVALAAASASRLEGATSTKGTAKMAVSKVVELRQYTLRGGKRDALIELFQREFVESQNELGARVLGTFRDLDDPDRFVWMRGFESMGVRGRALEAFYTGPVWRSHREVANATMLDSDNVMLLRSVAEGSSVGLGRGTGHGLLSVTSHALGSTPNGVFAEFFERRLRRLLVLCGAAPGAAFVTEEAPNNFPRLPVREGDPVFVWLAWWRDEQALERFERRFAASRGWRDNAAEALLPALMRKPERLRLVPADGAARLQ